MNMAHMIQNWLFAATLASSAAAMAGLFLSVAGQRSQLAVQIMMQYSDKFRIMLQAMPAEIVAARRSSTVPEATIELTRHTMAVFYVLMELHYLRQKRYLPADIWHLWFPNVKAVIGSPLFVREWQLLRPDFVAQPSFCHFVDSLQK